MVSLQHVHALPVLDNAGWNIWYLQRLSSSPFTIHLTKLAELILSSSIHVPCAWNNTQHGEAGEPLKTRDFVSESRTLETSCALVLEHVISIHG